jgi:indolepyruvate ferredoxin oxidoreductase
VLNLDVAPTGAFTQDPNWHISPDAMLQRVRGATRQTESLHAHDVATALMGDAIATNVFVLGYAWQQGWIPLSEASLMRAIELNDTAVTMNKAAFAWGRQAALDLARVTLAAGLNKPGTIVMMPPRTHSLDALIADRMPRLTGYQNAAYARHYETFVRDIAATEEQRVGGHRVAREVAISLYKLMAYKDEYEVARLFVETGFFKRIDSQFEGDYKLRFHLAPPLFSRRDKQGHLLKRTYGPWIATAYTWLARAKGLRGTPFDIFGYTAERRAERAAIDAFESLMKNIVAQLSADRLDIALALARLPQDVRGYGHVKARNAHDAQRRQDALLAEWEQPNPAVPQATHPSPHAVA